MRRILDGLGDAWRMVRGAAALAKLAWITRFRFRGRYWRWRWETAFGRGAPSSKRALILAGLAYGAWSSALARGRCRLRVARSQAQRVEVVR